MSTELSREGSNRDNGEPQASKLRRASVTLSSGPVASSNKRDQTSRFLTGSITASVSSSSRSRAELKSSSCVARV